MWHAWLFTLWRLRPGRARSLTQKKPAGRESPPGRWGERPVPRGEAARAAVTDGVAMITQHGQPTPATVPAGSGPNNGSKIHGCFLRVNIQAMRWRCDVRLDALTGRRVPGACGRCAEFLETRIHRKWIVVAAQDA